MKAAPHQARRPSYLEAGGNDIQLRPNPTTGTGGSFSSSLTPTPGPANGAAIHMTTASIPANCETTSPPGRAPISGHLHVWHTFPTSVHQIRHHFPTSMPTCWYIDRPTPLRNATPHQSSPSSVPFLTYLPLTHHHDTHPLSAISRRTSFPCRPFTECVEKKFWERV